LLTAMLTVTLVATFASAALWQQWRSVEIEAAERSRTQMQWVLNGALDWSRLILQEDARTGEVDHLSEPWALPLQEARLSSFLALDSNNTDDAMEAFLSGQITDQQALLNLRNLVQDGKLHLPTQQALVRLFSLLKLPQSQLQRLQDQWLASEAATSDSDHLTASGPSTPLTPHRMEQLAWLGLAPATLQALAPYCTLLPVPTPVNLNTASAEVLHAVLPDVDLGRARQLVAQRATAHFKTVTEALRAVASEQALPALLLTQAYSVGSQYFTVRGRLRLGDNAVQEVSLLERRGALVRVVWRQREALSGLAGQAAPAMASLQ
jgi:general secretion pathway protein K